MAYLSIRHQSRILVLQSLYEASFDGAKSVREVLSRNITSSGYKVDEAFCAKILDGIDTHQAEIDKMITETAPEWPLAQIATIDLSILRMSIFELIFDDEVPPKAVINEAVELGKAFGGDNSGKFINGVLGTIFRASKKFIDDDIVMAAGGIVYRELPGHERQFLAIKNMYKKWTFPKGRVQDNETWQEAALREIQEETGITEGEIIGEIGEISFTDRSLQETVNKNIHFYLVKTDQNTLLVDPEAHVIDVKWMTEKEIRQNLDYPNLIDLFEQALKMLEK